MRDLGLRLTSFASLVLLGPVLILQGRRVRRVTPRLPEAAGPREGQTAAADAPFRLLVAGESTAVGVGTSHQDTALAAAMAHALAAEIGRPVAWRAIGRSGATARALLTEFIEPAVTLRADAVVIVLGVNDTLGLASPARWVGALESLRRALDAQCTVPEPSRRPLIVLTGVPPMHRFPALPAPLRHVLGLRAVLLERAAARWAEGCGVLYVPHDRFQRADLVSLFATDGFHPSAEGYARWGLALARAVAIGLRTAPPAPGAPE